MGLTRIRAEQISDIDYKQAVRVITLTDITLTGGAPAEVDGVSLVEGNRVLVAGQSNAAQNGLYFVQTLGTGSNGTWVRTSDGNEDGEIQPGMVVMVTQGNEYADTPWKLITNGVIEIGVTELVFEENYSLAFGNVFANGTAVVANVVSAPLTLTAGDNISIVGNNTAKSITIGVTGITTSRIANGTSNVDIATANGNVTTTVNGNTVLTVTGTGSNVTGTLEVTGNVTANNFVGNLTGTANVATFVYVTESPDDSVTYNIAYLSPSGAANAPRSVYSDNTELTFNPGTNVLTVATGNITTVNAGTINVTTGIDLLDDDFVRFGTSDDANFFYDGTNNTMELELESAAVSFIITDNGTTRHTFSKAGVYTADQANLTTLNVQTINATVAIDLADDDILRFGTSDDWEMYHTAGGDNRMDLNTGNLVIRDDGTVGDPTRFTFVRTTGAFTATGNVTGGNLTTAGRVDATGNVTGGNLTTAGQVTATGNITGGNVIATTAVDLADSVDLRFGSSDDVEFYFSGLFNFFVTQLANTVKSWDIYGNNGSNLIASFSQSGNLQATGNIQGANVISNALVSAATVTATGNISAGNISTTGQLTTNNFVITGNVTGNLVPSANVTYDLGQNDARWNDLWLANSTIYLGNAQISANATSLTLTNPDGTSFEPAGSFANLTVFTRGSGNVNFGLNFGALEVVGRFGNISIPLAA